MSLQLPKLPFQEGEEETEFPPRLIAFPPTWMVIHNGSAEDKASAEKIAEYLMSKLPPVFAQVKEVKPTEEPDPIDLMAHGIVIIGGPGCWFNGGAGSKWCWDLLKSMDPGWENRGTEDSPDWWAVKEATEEAEAYAVQCTGDGSFAIISSVMGAFPWLTLWNVGGCGKTDTADAVELLLKGETKGIWIGGEKVA